MATFEAQVEALTSLSLDGSSAPTQSELSQFLTDGAKEVLNALPRMKQSLFTTSNDLNSSSTYLTLGGSEVFSVTRDDGTINQPCRAVRAELGGKIRDADDMMAATVTDPAYYITNGILSVVPEPTNSQNAHVQTLNYPTVAFGDSAITKFPDDAEYLVVLYGAIKSLQNYQSNQTERLISGSSISTPLTAIGTELGETQAICDLINTQVDAAVTQLGESSTQVDADIDTALAAINTAADRINTAVALANTQFDSAVTSNTAEDVELANSHVNAGNGFLSEARSSAEEASSFASEVQARIAQVGGYSQVVSGYINSAQGYANEIQSKISISQAYSNEVQTKIALEREHYSRHEKMQMKLQADYDKGLQYLMGGS
tara:strand:- start:2718 stop:3839 length:1122 start_codon:yes stop_codon:yes gene_type:complete